MQSSEQSSGGKRQVPKQRRRRVLAATIILVGVALGLWSCFPGPVYDLWPPGKGEPRHTIEVLYKDWHTLVVIPVPADSPTGGPSYVEWEFCEKGWYLDGRQGFSGVLRSLFWPSTSGVSEKKQRRPLWERYRGDDLERWSFTLSRKGYDAMMKYMKLQPRAPIGGHPGWYTGADSYHLFFSCHHFTASALRAAGLPIRPWWAFSAWMVEIQLDRIERFHIAEGL